MPSPSVTHSFSNSTTADATQVNTNFTDLINAMSDGSKDFSINALTCAGAATLNGNVTLGNATGDDITVTGSLASSIPIKTTATYNFGSSTLGLLSVYLGNSTYTTRLLANTLGASNTITFPAATVTLASLTGTETLTNKTLTGNIAVNLVSGAATVTLPTTTSTLATLALSETLTNKTMALASNTLTGANNNGIIYANGSGTLENNANLTYSSGLFKVGATTKPSSRHEMHNDSSTAEVLYLRNHNTTAGDSDSRPGLVIVKGSTTNTSDQKFAHFYINAEGTASGAIVANGAGAATFGTVSDRRLKENIQDLPSQLQNIMKLRPVEYDFIGAGHQEGFIAQEVEEVYPDLISRDEKGFFMIAGLSKMEARLIKAIQEIKNEFDAYKASHP